MYVFIMKQTENHTSIQWYYWGADTHNSGATKQLCIHDFHGIWKRKKTQTSKVMQCQKWSKLQRKNLPIQSYDEYISRTLTPTPFGWKDQITCTFTDINTGIYRKWGNGGQKRSKSTYPTNFTYFTKACQRTWNRG